MHEGRKAKARRGELILGLPRGYVLKPSGEVALDPDEEVQRVIRLVFALFERRRSISGVLRYLVDYDIALPDRIRSGPEKGDVCWNRPNTATLGDMLRHPGYAGPMSSGAVTMTDVSDFPANRTAVDALFAIHKNGWCCTKMPIQRTLTGNPMSGIRN